MSGLARIVKKVVKTIGGLFDAPELPSLPAPPPAPEALPVTPLPDTGDVALQAKKRQAAARKRVGGRADTILSDTLG